MITPEDLKAELSRQKIAVSLRTLTDWRQKGLLPELKRKGAGKGKGAIHYWDDPDVIVQAAIISESLSHYRNTENVILKLWAAGFPVSDEKAKDAWLNFLNDEIAKKEKKAKKFTDGYFGLIRSWINRIYRKGGSLAHNQGLPLPEVFQEHFERIYNPDFEFDHEAISGLIIELFRLDDSPETYRNIDNALYEIEPIYSELFSINSAAAFVETFSIDEMAIARKSLRLINLIAAKYFEISAKEVDKFAANYIATQLTRELGRFLGICLIHLQRHDKDYPIIESLHALFEYVDALSEGDLTVTDNYQLSISDKAKANWEITKSEIKKIWSELEISAELEI